MEIEIRAIVVTVSDTRDIESDRSGETLSECLMEIGAKIVSRRLIKDDFEVLKEALADLTDEDINLLVTTGGTGITPRDNTPDATIEILEKEIRGISEAMRFETLSKTRRAMLSRGVSGIRNNTLVINFPGSPKGVVETFDAIKVVIPHAIAQLEGYADH
ncbi:MAG: molybdenum cofactor biosynthesis protein B [Pyrinomonadaceae bacterium]